MKKSNIIAGTAAIVAILAVTGIAASTFAADNTDTGNYPFRERMGRAVDRFENLTDEEKAELKATREERMADREARREAVQSALESGNYNDWVAAIGEDAPILEKVNADNFDRLVEVHNLREQARSIMQDELGIEESDFGPDHMHRGMHRFMGK